MTAQKHKYYNVGKENDECQEVISYCSRLYSCWLC